MQNGLATNSNALAPPQIRKFRCHKTSVSLYNCTKNLEISCVEKFAWATCKKQTPLLRLALPNLVSFCAQETRDLLTLLAFRVFNAQNKSMNDLIFILPHSLMQTTKVKNLSIN